MARKNYAAPRVPSRIEFRMSPLITAWHYQVADLAETTPTVSEMESLSKI